MNYNYHSHTARCGHASGTPEEYIKRAIENGIRHMGFSEHAPFVFPDGYESSYRVPMAEAADYISELSRLREKYKNDIDLKIGFEMEYYPAYFESMLKTVKKVGGEYLILGHHFLHNEHPAGKSCYIGTDAVGDLKEYTDSVIAGMESGVFTYVAHPDMFTFSGDVAVYREEMRRICVASGQLNIPLEINFLGIRTHRRYPHEGFWEIAGECGSPVTFGFDSHDVAGAFDGESIIEAHKLVEKYRLNYIGEPKLISIK